MERHTLLALSTAHLEEHEFNNMIAISDKLPIRYASHGYGGIIFINLVANLDNYDWSFTPNLRPIVEYCIEENIMYVDFDRDVEVCDKFKVFDW